MRNRGKRNGYMDSHCVLDVTGSKNTFSFKPPVKGRFSAVIKLFGCQNLRKQKSRVPPSHPQIASNIIFDPYLQYEISKKNARELKLAVPLTLCYNGTHLGVLRRRKHTRKISARQTHRPLHDGSERCVFFLLLEAVDKFHGPDCRLSCRSSVIHSSSTIRFIIYSACAETDTTMEQIFAP